MILKEGIEKELKIWTEFAWFNTTCQKLADQTIMILKKRWFSDHEIQEICWQIKREEYVQDTPNRIKTWNAD